VQVGGKHKKGSHAPLLVFVVLVFIINAIVIFKILFFVVLLAVELGVVDDELLELVVVDELDELVVVGNDGTRKNKMKKTKKNDFHR
jgi:hypothetical protein